MPIYAFRCEACGHKFDRLQKLSDADPVECPECGASSLKRQVTAPSFRLAGSGWYETDFKSDKDKQRNLAGKDEPPAKKDEATQPAAASTEKSAVAPAVAPASTTSTTQKTDGAASGG